MTDTDDLSLSVQHAAYKRDVAEGRIVDGRIVKNPPWPILSRAERNRAHGQLDPAAVRMGFEEALQLTPISEHGFQAQLLMRRILDQPGGVGFVCELFQPRVLPK